MSQSKNVQQSIELANTVGQVGCLIGVAAIGIIGAAFGLGWWIDGLLGNETKIVTLIFMLGSFPVSLYVMVQIGLRTAARANAIRDKMKQKDLETQDEDTDE